MSNFPYRKLGELCTILSSKRIFAKEYIESGVPFYRSKEIIQKHNGEKINTELFISDERFSEIESKYGVPKENDMLMTSVGTLGVAYVVSGEDHFYFKDGNLTWYKDFSSELNSKYLFYLFDSELGKDLIKSVAIGSSQSALTIDGMKNLEVPCPDICIQEKIVKLLKTYDSLIENNNRRIAILEEMAQKLYREWFVHFRFPGHENVKMMESEMGLIPEGWAVSPASAIGQIVGGGTPSTKNESYFTKDGIPWLCPRDFSREETKYIARGQKDITEEGYKSSGAKMMPAGSIVFSSRAPIGYTAIAINPLCTNQGFKSIVPNNDVSSEYVYYYLKNNLPLIDGYASGSTFKEISSAQMKLVPFLVPSVDVMFGFERISAGLGKKTYNLQQKNTNLRKTRDLLLSRLISGDIDVSELDIPIKEG
ncbi:MAG TPA: restriction endonuclease subunit S [Clostridiales bacterium]|nr:restriction endonuclease subunit S [Clostridiales bacterium]